MCYSGMCEWEDHMGDCRWFNDGSPCPCPEQFFGPVPFKERMRRIFTVQVRGGIVLALTFILTCAVLTRAPIGVDWESTFSRVTLSDLYQTKAFLNPPFTVLLLPHAYLPLRWGNAINLTLNIAVILFAINRLGGDWAALALVFTSPIFFALCHTNNIDWIPLLGLVIAGPLGPIFVMCKPQSLGGVLFIWFRREELKNLLPLLAALLLSFALWGFWPLRVGSVLPFGKPYNFSPFPVGLLLGVPLFLKAWRTDDVYLAAVITPLFVPYILPHSLVAVLVVLACKFPKAARWFYLAVWTFTIIGWRRINQ